MGIEMSRPAEVRRIIECPGYIRGLKRLKNKHKYEEILDVLDMVDRLRTFQITNQKSNHKLKGNKNDYKDIHIRGNLILLYKYVNDDIYIDLELKDLTDHDFGLSKKRKLK